MRWMKSTGLMVAAIALLTMSASDAVAQTLSGGANGAAISVQWTPVPGATSYNIVVTGSASIDASVPASPTAAAASPVPPGTYNIRVRALVGGVPGPFSNEVSVSVGGTAPPPGGCAPVAAPTLTITTNGTSVTASWTGVAGASGFRLQIGTSPGGTIAQVDFQASQTSYTVPNAPIGTYYARVLAANACLNLTPSAEQSFTVGAATPGPPSPAPPPGAGPRTADPLPSQLCNPQLPHEGACIPKAVAIAQLDAALRVLEGPYNFELQNSCTAHGGNNAFLVRTVNYLRATYDTRWGFNNKRGHFGSRSEDVVVFNPTHRPDQGEGQIYVFDIMGNHCPENGRGVTAGVNDVTGATWYGGDRSLCAPGNRPDQGGTWCARWTINWNQ